MTINFLRDRIQSRNMKGLQDMKKATKKFVVAVLLAGLLVIVGKPSINPAPRPF